MATEGVSMQANTASDRSTAQLVNEHSQAFQNRLDTTVTDSEPPVEAEKPALPDEQPTVETEPDVPKGAGEMDTEPPVAEPAESPLGGIPIARESQISIGPKNETTTGEKRDIDSTVTPTPALVGGEEQQKPELLGEPGAKKLKTAKEPSTDFNGTDAGLSNVDDQIPKKASRTKKEKIKDAVKKVIPGDGIGSRTRSRTKGA
ncbi:hypothetical protein N7457_008839 [Penicillium paradoxum]|uniref:uncharacterized protein n=1 Tax=Penicillium paradoxum TaxID=176176 RepID=UPI002546E8B7|nr:uncharacterized protein N7457_008839 [Penicillium paradoxum]KAJ5773943.1 hypothetical protein N7457_008839 [Penicillium paradoxum]